MQSDNGRLLCIINGNVGRCAEGSKREGDGIVISPDRRNPKKNVSEAAQCLLMCSVKGQLIDLPILCLTGQVLVKSCTSTKMKN